MMRSFWLQIAQGRAFCQWGKSGLLKCKQVRRVPMFNFYKA